MIKAEIYHPYTILVAVDYSDTGAEALNRALTIAVEDPRAELHVVHVMKHEDSHLGEDYKVTVETESLRVTAEFKLHECIDNALYDRAGRGEATSINIQLHIAGGGPALHIAQLAADLRADVIVVGTHGRTGINRWIKGSVAEDVLRRAHCPVLVVRGVDYGGVERAPDLEPLCVDCGTTRFQSHGDELWCSRHKSRSGWRHTEHGGAIPRSGGTIRSWTA